MYTRADLERMSDAAAADHGVPPAGLRALFAQESGWDPAAVNQVTGAAGIGQFMPATAAELGIDPFDPAQAIPAAALYLTQIRAYLIGRLGRWSWPLVLSGYNWGMGNTANAAEQHGDGWMAHVPEETRDYVRRVGPAFGDRGALVLVVAAVAVAAMWVLA